MTEKAESIEKQLAKPFKIIHWRVLRSFGNQVSCAPYITVRDTRRRLNKVFGVNGWQTKLVEVKGGFTCELSCLIDDQWITKTDAGGEQGDNLKTTASDALKRAAMNFGVGEYLHSWKVVYLPAKDKKALNSKGKQINDPAELTALCQNIYEANLERIQVEHPGTVIPKEQRPAKKTGPIDTVEIKNIDTLIRIIEETTDKAADQILASIYKTYKVKSIRELTKDKLPNVINRLNSTISGGNDEDKNNKNKQSLKKIKGRT
ncbi:hypothetical protein KAR91_69440 [Candidatus Pacearchaeota archaeon]|nr:hypothetical protein [Candidatus Pacearchaeota archaeon]